MQDTHTQIRRRLQTRPTPLLGLIYCRRLNVKRFVYDGRPYVMPAFGGDILNNVSVVQLYHYEQRRIDAVNNLYILPVGETSSLQQICHIIKFIVLYRYSKQENKRSKKENIICNS